VGKNLARLSDKKPKLDGAGAIDIVNHMCITD
jgi:hypothetical protein